MLRQAARSEFEAVLVALPSELASHSRYGRKLNAAAEDDRAAWEELNRIEMPERYSVVATSDAWLRFVQRNRNALDQRFAQVLHPDGETLDFLLDKAAFADWCEKNDIPAPRRYSVPEISRAKTVVMLRPVQSGGNGSPASVAKAAEFSDMQALRERVAELENNGVNYIATESLLGRNLDQLSIGFAQRPGASRIITALKTRPSAAACSCGTFVVTVDDEPALLLAKRILEVLDYYGMGEIEVLRDRETRECFVIEINARPWLQYGLVMARDDDWLSFLLFPQSQPLTSISYRRVAWINFLDDLYVCFSRDEGEVRRGNVGLLNYLSSLLRARAYAAWSWRDPQPYWAALRQFFRSSSS
jgi:predicted ATP-grasp superfamily ATP-dependent carboligase